MTERGSVSALMLAVLAVVALTCLALADAANVLLARSRAQNAADAAALAAAAEQWPFLGGSHDPAAAAIEVAEANGAELESCECPLRGRDAKVVVSVATSTRMLRHAGTRVRARSVASLDPGLLFREP